MGARGTGIPGQRRLGAVQEHRIASQTEGRPSAGGGFTLIELVLVMSVLLVGLLALAQSLDTSMRLADVNRETAFATNGLRDAIEVLEGVEDFSTLFALYNTDPSDDPGPPGSAPGSAFAVEGLEPAEDDPDGFVGEIVFPTSNGAGGVELREDLDDATLSMPRDLNGDGMIDAEDHSGDYRLLPLALRLRWRGHSGERSMEVQTLIADR